MPVHESRLGKGIATFGTHLKAEGGNLPVVSTLDVH